MPSPLLVTSRNTPVSSLVSTIDAPGRMAPCSSVTFPAIGDVLVARGRALPRAAALRRPVRSTICASVASLDLVVAARRKYKSARRTVINDGITLPPSAKVNGFLARTGHPS